MKNFEFCQQNLAASQIDAKVILKPGSSFFVIKNSEAFALKVTVSQPTSIEILKVSNPKVIGRSGELTNKRNLLKLFRYGADKMIVDLCFNFNFRESDVKVERVKNEFGEVKTHFEEFLLVSKSSIETFSFQLKDQMGKLNRDNYREVVDQLQGKERITLNLQLQVLKYKQLVKVLEYGVFSHIYLKPYIFSSTEQKVIVKLIQA